MPDLIRVMSDHHKHCDEAFAQAEQAAQSNDWAACADLTQALVGDTLAHFAAEEAILFPAFERATGMTMGPTRMMRMEHEQMRELLEQLQAASAAHDHQTYFGTADTLLVMMEQHNMKEENILYPMCAQHLHSETGLVEALNTALATASF